MFQLAFLIGIYSYIIFFLGLAGVLYPNIILTISLLYFLTAIILLRKRIRINLKLKLDSWSKIILLLIFAQALVNLVGALGPEISFDSLWYHLTLPKLYLLSGAITHVSGGLLYYSDMPKSIEMLYISALSLNGEIMAKLIHYVFGLLCALATYKLSRRFLSEKFSLLACLVFYTNLVVGWQSITAHIDLGRTFFEILALWQFFEWTEKRNIKKLIYTGIFVGLSISTKLVALNSLFVFLLLIIFVHIMSKSKIKDLLKSFSVFILFSVLVPLPWLIFSFLNTGNLLYPLMDSRVPLEFSNNLLNVPKLFLFASDPISPLYLVFLPLIVILFKKFDKKLILLSLYCLLAIVFWYLTSAIGGSRFILPYLPAFSILIVSVLPILKNETFKKYLYLVIFIVSFLSIFYRGLANSKYVPVILGTESKEKFLSENLNFSFGDFYDTDGYFKKNINSKDKVLLYGFHNLFYVEFPFIDSSWVKKGDAFNYIATQNTSLSQRFSDWKEIYYNGKTGVRLYTKENKEWIY